MRKFEEMGLAGLVEPPPPLSPFGRFVVSCWHWCGGWAPERIPSFLSYEGGVIGDFEALIEALQLVHRALNEENDGE